ncbi:MAG: diaminopimelate epimerase [Chloroflexi bacterium]|nr:diaminopimelate epimerase [Chloroflexota bacterium]
MQFVKMHGAGNDFVMVDARGLQRPWPELAVQVCDRHFGVGADGLILVLPAEGADFRMRIFNPDGSEAEMCGNGIRCFAKFVVEDRLLSQAQETLRVETLAGVLSVRPAWVQGRIAAVQVSMGQPRFQPEDLPVALPSSPAYVWDHPLAVDGHALKLSFASMGNPHAVHFLETPVADFPLERIGPQVETHPLFPRRVNFEIARVVDRGHMDVRVWERGAGLTLACGTGACAVAAIAIARGLVDTPVEVRLPGGVLTIAWDGQGEVFMTGPVAEIFRGVWHE